MKKYIAALAALALALILAGYYRYMNGMAQINPLTSDIPWVVIAIVGGLALVGVIVLLVMGKKGKK